MATREKVIHFYQLWATRGGSSRLVDAGNWRDLLQAWTTDRKLGETLVDDVYCVPDLTQRFPVLGMHKEVDHAFQSRLDEKTSDVTDFLDVDGDSIAANSTAAVFLPQRCVVAMTFGNVSAPRAKALRAFLDTVVPLDKEEKWEVRPILDRGRVEQFRDESAGIRRVEASFSTAKDLLTAVDGEQGMAAAVDRIAKEVGGELNVKLVFSLSNYDKQKAGTRAKFKKFVERSLDRLVNADKAEVLTVAQDGSDEAILSLVEQNFCVHVDVETDVLESKSFSRLIATTVDASAKRETEIYRIVT